MKTQTYKKTLLLAAPMAMAFSVTIPQNAEAQRQAPSKEEQREQRNERNENLTPEERQKAREARFQERLRNMTPEQRQKWDQQVKEWRAQREANGGQGGWGGPGGGGGGGNEGGWNRGGGPGGGRDGGRGGDAAPQAEVDYMAYAGITDPKVRDAIAEFVNAQAAARKPLLEKARQLTFDLGKVEITSEEIGTRMTAFRAELVVDQKRYEDALKELDLKIGYTKNPRLEVFLTMGGVLGYEAPQVGGAIAIFTNLIPPTPAPAPINIDAKAGQPVTPPAANVNAKAAPVEDGPM